MINTTTVVNNFLTKRGGSFVPIGMLDYWKMILNWSCKAIVVVIKTKFQYSLHRRH